MPAPDFQTLYDFEDQIETAVAAVLTSVLTPILTPLSLTCPIFVSRDIDTKETPRVEVEFATGASLDQRGAFGQANPKQIPTSFTGVLTVGIVTTRPLDSMSQAHGQIRGAVRYALSAGAKLFNTGNLPYLQILDLLPSSTAPNLQQNKEQDVTVLQYAMKFAISNDAWPSSP
jgi:hypothetical protein